MSRPPRSRLRRLLDGLVTVGELPVIHWFVLVVSIPFWPLFLLLFGPWVGRPLAAAAILGLCLGAGAVNDSAESYRELASDMAGPDTALDDLSIGDTVRLDASILMPNAYRSHEGKKVVAYETRVYLISETKDSDDDTVTHRTLAFRERKGPKQLSISAMRRGQVAKIPLRHWRPSFERRKRLRRAKTRESRWLKVSYQGRFISYDVYEEVLYSDQKVFLYGVLDSEDPPLLAAFDPDHGFNEGLSHFPDVWRTNMLWDQDRWSVAARYQGVSRTKELIGYLLLLAAAIYLVVWMYFERWYWPEEDNRLVAHEDDFGPGLSLLGSALCIASAAGLWWSGLERPEPWQLGLLGIASMYPVAATRRYERRGSAVALGVAGAVLMANIGLALFVDAGSSTLITSTMLLLFLMLPTLEKKLAELAASLRHWWDRSHSEVHRRWHEAEAAEERTLARITLETGGDEGEWVPVSVLWSDGSTEDAEFQIPAPPHAPGTTLQLTAPSLSETPNPGAAQGYRESEQRFRRELSYDRAEAVIGPSRSSLRPIGWSLAALLAICAVTSVAAHLLAAL